MIAFMLYYRHNGREVDGVAARYNKLRKLLFGRKIRGAFPQWRASLFPQWQSSAMANLSASGF